MSNKSSKKARSSAQILAEIAALPPSVQGTISSYKNVRKNGTAAGYYNLQYTHKDKNQSFAIPVDKVEDFKAAITAHKYLVAPVPPSRRKRTDTNALWNLHKPPQGAA